MNLTLYRHWSSLLFFVMVSLSPTFAQKKHQQTLDSLEKLYQQSQGKLQRLKVLNALVKFKHKQRIQKESIPQQAQEAIALAKQLKPSIVGAQAYSNQAIILRSQSKLDASSSFFHKAISVLNKIPKSSELSLTLFELGNNYRKTFSFDSSKYYIKQAIEIDKALQNFTGLVKAHNALGLTFKNAGNYTQGLAHYLKALETLETKVKTPNKKLLTRLNLNIGNLYFRQEEPDKALKYYTKALEFAKTTKFKLAIAILYGNIGNVYDFKNDFKKSIDYYEKSLQATRELGIPGRIAASLDNLGVSYRNQKDYSKALKYHLEATKIREKIKDPKGLANSYINLGRVYTELRKLDEATHYMDSAYVLAKRHKLARLMTEYYAEQSDLDSAKGNMAAALESYKYLVTLKDSLYSAAKAKQLAEMAEKYESEKKAREIKQQKLALANKNLTIKQRNGQIYALSAVGMLILFLALMFFRGRQKQKKLNSILTHQKEEILTQNEEITAQKEALYSQSEELKITNEQLMQLDEFKQRMTGMIVHDLKTPLSSIIGLSDENDHNQDLQFIHQSGKQMLHMVLNILDVQKFQEVEVPLTLDNYELQTLAVDSINQVKLLLNEKQITLDNDFSANHFIKVDYSLINRVIVNLLSNAIKYTPAGGSIQLISSDLPTSSNFLKICVQDQGIGIDPTQVEHIFSSFGQVNARNSGRVRSTGLGLTFCKLVVEAHGGSIGVDSVPDQGSTFWFTVPTGSKSSHKTTTPQPLYSSHSLDFNFQTEELAQLQQVLKQIENREIYELSAIKNVLDKQVWDDYPNLSKWRELLKNAMYNWNETQFKELTDPDKL